MILIEEIKNILYILYILQYAKVAKNIYENISILQYLNFTTYNFLVKIYFQQTQKLSLCCAFTEALEPRAMHSEGLHEGAVESTSQAALEPMQELTVHGVTQGESSDAVSIYTASTSVSGNGKFTNSKKNIYI